MRRLLAVLIALTAVAPASAGAMQIDPPTVETAPAIDPPIAWRHSIAIGKPFAGRLVDGVQLPAEGRDFWTYDWGLRGSPNRPWRRWGTDRLVLTLLDVIGAYRAANPRRPARRGSRTCHARRAAGSGRTSAAAAMRRTRTAWTPTSSTRGWTGWSGARGRRSWSTSSFRSSSSTRFVAAGAVYVFTGPRLYLHGPRRTVVALAHHDDHMHVRIR